MPVATPVPMGHCDAAPPPGLLDAGDEAPGSGALEGRELGPGGALDVDGGELAPVKPGAEDGQLPTWVLPRVLHQFGAETPGNGAGMPLPLPLPLGRPFAARMLPSPPWLPVSPELLPHALLPARNIPSSATLDNLLATRFMKEGYFLLNEFSPNASSVPCKIMVKSWGYDARRPEDLGPAAALASMSGTQGVRRAGKAWY